MNIQDVIYKLETLPGSELLTEIIVDLSEHIKQASSEVIMHFIKISGTVLIGGKDRELRFPTKDVKWWGESYLGAYETEIRVSNGDIIRTQIPIYMLDQIMEAALEKIQGEKL